MTSRQSMAMTSCCVVVTQFKTNPVKDNYFYYKKLCFYKNSIDISSSKAIIRRGCNKSIGKRSD
jgi:hypothetical protein